MAAEAVALLGTGTAAKAREVGLRLGSWAAGRDGVRMTRRRQRWIRPHTGARPLLPRPCEQSYGGLPLPPTHHPRRPRGSSPCLIKAHPFPSSPLTYPPTCSDRDGDVEISSTKRRRGDPPPPTAAVLDAAGGGGSEPDLRAMLHSRSGRSLREAAGDPLGGAGAADGEATTQSGGKGTRSGRSGRK